MNRLGATALLIACQLALLGGILVWAARPLWQGTEYRLHVEPIDPRSLMRGNYVALNYGFTTLDVDTLPNDLDTLIRPGKVVYLQLAWAPDSSTRVQGVFTQRPTEGVVLKAWVTYYSSYYSEGGRRQHLTLRTGLEQYYCPPDEARAWERRLRPWLEGTESDVAHAVTYARIRVLPSGEARVVGLELGPAVVEPEPEPVLEPQDVPADTTPSASRSPS
ncbi:MAG: GDYXXLXY domain-containing protein [Bacteroidia bacterium]|nr:GDYXXLXY domain-containing protein [Bacteroidia bacterium]